MRVFNIANTGGPRGMGHVTRQLSTSCLVTGMAYTDMETQVSYCLGVELQVSHPGIKLKVGRH